MFDLDIAEFDFSCPECVPYLTLGDKTTFLIQIDIFPQADSASKRPIPEIEVISEADLKTEIESGKE